MEVTVPDGVGAGEIIAFETPEGALMEVAVPDGLQAGDVFTVELEPPQADPPPDPPPVEPTPDWADEDQENVPPMSMALAAPASQSQAVSTRDGRELVLALVTHSQKCLQEDMAPFLEAHCHLFEQDLDELRSGAGETHEQYTAFTAFVDELEGHFDQFVSSRGFASAHECFAAIDAAVVADVAEQKREMEKLEKSLRALQRRLMSAMGGDGDGADDQPGGSANGHSDSSSDDEDENNGLMSMMPLLAVGGGGEDGDGSASGGGGGSGGRAPMMPLMMFSQPMTLEDLIEQARTATLTSSL